MAKNGLLSEQISEPLDGATSARFELHAGDGNLTVDTLNDAHVLASGTLEYTEKQGLPHRSLEVQGDQACLSLRGNQDLRPRFRLPWSACNGATNWLIHLNPQVAADIVAHSDGGNLKLDLRSMHLMGLSAETGGGNIEIALPDRARHLRVVARTGAGNVSISLPSGVAVRVHATSGLGKLVMDPRFSQLDKSTYQSPDYDSAAKKVEITAGSGAGNVSVIST